MKYCNVCVPKRGNRTEVLIFAVPEVTNTVLVSVYNCNMASHSVIGKVQIATEQTLLPFLGL